MRVLPDRAHSFAVDVAKAEAIQRRLSEFVRLEPLRRPIRTAAGVYVLFGGDADGAHAAACAAVLEVPGFCELEVRFAGPVAVPLPYQSGLFAFCVAPAMIEVLESLTTDPDVLLVPAHGIAHPRGLGLASHLGVLFDIAAIGCADSLLFGEAPAIGPGAGDRASVTVEGRPVAGAVRTRAGAKPIFVSPAYRTDLESAVEAVLSCVGQFRTPEPIRRARTLLRQARGAATAMARMEAGSRKQE